MNIDSQNRTRVLGRFINTVEDSLVSSKVAEVVFTKDLQPKATTLEKNRIRDRLAGEKLQSEQDDRTVASTLAGGQKVRVYRDK